jgi:hypothetical protein
MRNKLSKADYRNSLEYDSLIDSNTVAYKLVVTFHLIVLIVSGSLEFNEQLKILFV